MAWDLKVKNSAPGKIQTAHEQKQRYIMYYIWAEASATNAQKKKITNYHYSIIMFVNEKTEFTGLMWKTKTEMQPREERKAQMCKYDDAISKLWLF